MKRTIGRVIAAAGTAWLLAAGLTGQHQPGAGQALTCLEVLASLGTAGAALLARIAGQPSRAAMPVRVGRAVAATAAAGWIADTAVADHGRIGGYYALAALIVIAGLVMAGGICSVREWITAGSGHALRAGALRPAACCRERRQPRRPHQAARPADTGRAPRPAVIRQHSTSCRQEGVQVMRFSNWVRRRTVRRQARDIRRLQAKTALARQVVARTDQMLAAAGAKARPE